MLVCTILSSQIWNEGMSHSYWGLGQWLLLLMDPTIPSWGLIGHITERLPLLCGRNLRYQTVKWQNAFKYSTAPIWKYHHWLSTSKLIICCVHAQHGHTALQKKNTAKVTKIIKFSNVSLGAYALSSISYFRMHVLCIVCTISLFSLWNCSSVVFYE